MAAMQGVLVGAPTVLRADSALPSPTSLGAPSGMVSLDLLMGQPTRDTLQAVDPSDPLVQQLVQDRNFLTAVQTSQLHTAACAAVRLLRSHFEKAGEFKRPADRRAAAPREPTYAHDDAPTPRSAAAAHHHHHHHHHAAPASAARGGGGSAAAPGPHVVQRQLVEPRHREALRCMRLEVLDLEDVIPWNSVRRTWKTKRTTWRRQVKQTEAIPDFAARLKELKAALLTEEAPLPGCGPTWRAQLEACISGKGSYGLLASAWEELRTTVQAWLEGRSKPPPLSGVQLQAGAARAVRAMQAALAGASGGGEAAADAALAQVPLEAVVGGDSGAGLAAVRQAIDVEQRILHARLAAAGAAPDGGPADPQQQAAALQQQQQGGGQPLVSYFSSIQAAWADSDAFDSGADSDPMGGASSDTDLETGD